MSIVVKDPNNQLVIYTKGADSIIMDRLQSEIKFKSLIIILKILIN